jgi:hypothetical protein
MSVVKGENVVLSFFDGGFYKPAACGLSCTFEYTTELLNTSVRGTGNFSTFVPSVDTWGVSCDGIVSLEETNKLDLAELRQIQINHQQIYIRFTRTSITGEVYECNGYCYITASADTGNFGGMNTFSITLKGNGAFTQTFVPSPINPPGTMHDFYINLSGAQTGDTYYVMATNKDIIGAFRQIDQIIITSGSPSINQIKYDSTTGILSWLNPLEADEVIHIQYQDL